MPFSKFISIVLGILGSYYFIIVLFDVLKSRTHVIQPINHAIQFESNEEPVVIVDDPKRSESFFNPDRSGNHERYFPTHKSGSDIDSKLKSPIIDLGLETISGDAYTVNAENLSKFMMY